MAASYPTSVKSFTTKNAGDTIQPAHINDLQEEVAAIETGLLNGASPFASSNSTLANLNVPGGSTFGTLSVSSGSTLAAAQITAATCATLQATASTLVGAQITNATCANLQATTSTLVGAQITNATVASLQATASTLVNAQITNATCAALQATASTIGDLVITSSVTTPKLTVTGLGYSSNLQWNTGSGANLWVTDTASFDRSVQFSSNCTIAGTLTVNKIVSTSLTAALGSHIRVFAGGPAEISSASTMTKLALSQEIEDRLAEWDSTTFTFTPQSSGYYAINGRAQCVTGAVGTFAVSLWVNDTLVAADGCQIGAGVTEGYGAISLVMNLSSGAAGSVQFRGRAASTARCSSGLYTALDISKLA